VIGNPGRGVFSTVLLCQDSAQNNSEVVVKVIRNNLTMYKAALRERDFLKILGGQDEENKKHVVKLYDSFEQHGHMCLVFEPMADNLRHVVKKIGGGTGINIDAVRSYARQLFIALHHLNKCRIVHADLKPDNILVSHDQRIVKICDLGSAGNADTDCEITPYLVSRFYRAPEICLGLAYDTKIDIFSMGCILFEMYTGKILFNSKDNSDMLRMVQEMKGGFPKKMLRTATMRDKHFDEDMFFKQLDTDPLTGTVIEKKIQYTHPTRDLLHKLSGGRSGLSEHERTKLRQLADLVGKCLTLVPQKRISVAEALRHPFLSSDD
jgi:serine/threonine-protein kinase PRP4